MMRRSATTMREVQRVARRIEILIISDDHADYDLSGALLHLQNSMPSDARWFFRASEKGKPLYEAGTA